MTDPKFEEAKALLKEEGLVLSVNMLKKRLSIGSERAKNILEALKPLIVHTPADDDLLGSPSEEPVPVGLPTEEGIPPVNSESPSEESPVSTETPEELPTPSSVDSRARSGVVKGSLLGYCPSTGAEVYAE
jgi:hypothetical protein